MGSPQPKLESERVLIDHTSRDGPMVTHVRGIVLANSIANLRRIGVYDEYVRHIPPPDLEVILGTVAASWVPVAHVIAHYRACDVLGLTRSSFDEIGAAAAERVTKTFMAGFMRRAKGMGIDGMRFAVMHLPKLNERLFKGGRCTIVELGPKEVHIERHGLPFAHSAAYREGYLAFTQTIASLFTDVVYVKSVRPRVADEDGLAIRVSWV